MAHYLHWSYDAVMSMDHMERRRWVAEVARMNERINDLGAVRDGGRPRAHGQ